LGFGCGGLSGILNTPLSHEAGCSVIKEAFYRGITFFDTADFYGHNHDNEIMIGKVLLLSNPIEMFILYACLVEICIQWTK
jgi:aryl-alcohol dehydrogenase-like predicted oxidoreductase